MRIKVVKNAIKTVNTITDSFNTILSYDLDDDQKQKIEDQFEKIMELLYQNEKNE